MKKDIHVVHVALNGMLNSTLGKIITNLTCCFRRNAYSSSYLWTKGKTIKRVSGRFSLGIMIFVDLFCCTSLFIGCTSLYLHTSLFIISSECSFLDNILRRFSVSSSLSSSLVQILRFYLVDILSNRFYTSWKLN